ncbi:MAG: ribosome assembly factor SBDS [Thaumarchaeota archaeon]|nr:ribosome assembly factor SBDS [Nitrososphaerota archaeon]MCL5317345.1 ribosome assembly factor SBDS [Nitrososphaerota archaeon]
MSGKFTTVRLTVDGERFEILVNPDNALSFKLGRNVELSQVIAIDEVYSDSSKGLRANTEKMKKSLGTADHAEAAKIVLKRGELQLTTDQRRKMVEDKRKQIVSIIARNFVDPRTGLPHPPTRIEQAMGEIRVSIDPFKDVQEQTKMVVDQLRPVIPLKSEKMKIRVKVPPQFAPQAIGVLKGSGEILKEEWGSDGSLTALVEITAGMHAPLLERLGSATRGAAQATVER